MDAVVRWSSLPVLLLAVIVGIGSPAAADTLGSGWGWMTQSGTKVACGYEELRHPGGSGPGFDHNIYAEMADPDCSAPSVLTDCSGQFSCEFGSQIIGGNINGYFIVTQFSIFDYDVWWSRAWGANYNGSAIYNCSYSYYAQGRWRQQDQPLPVWRATATHPCI